MAAPITKIRTYATIPDGRSVLENGQIARPFYIPTWTKLRVAVRLQMTSTGADIVGPKFYIGLCSGAALGEMPLDAGAKHFVGISTALDWTYYVPAVPIEYYSMHLRATTIVNGAYSDNATQIASNIAFPANVLVAERAMLFADITRVGYPGSGSYIVNSPFYFWSTPAFVPDASKQDFKDQSQIEVPNLNFGDPGQTYATGTPRTITVDEGTNGVFNHACAAWTMPVPLIEICDIDVVKLA